MQGGVVYVRTGLEQLRMRFLVEPWKPRKIRVTSFAPRRQQVGALVNLARQPGVLMSSRLDPTRVTPGTKSSEATQNSLESTATPTAHSRLDEFLLSQRLLTEREPELQEKIGALRTAEQAFNACADERHVCPIDTGEHETTAAEQSERALGMAKRWLVQWMPAADALQKIPHPEPVKLLNVPHAGRLLPAREVVARVEVVKQIFLDFVRNGDSSRERIERSLTRLFERDPNSFQALAWFFRAVAIELHVIANDLGLSDEERRSREDFLRAGRGGETAPVDQPEQVLCGYCGGDSRYPDSEWMLVPDAVRASGMSESTLKRRIKALPVGDRGETEPKARLVVRTAALRRLVEREGRRWNGAQEGAG